MLFSVPPPNRVSPVWSFVTFGMAEYCLQAVLLLAMCLLLRRFRVSYLFSFVTAVVYGFVLDAFMVLGAMLPVDSMALLGDGLDFPADPKEVLRILELLRVAFQLLLVEGAKVRRAAIADEKGAEDNVHHLPVFSVDSSTGPHAVVLALIVADVMWCTT